MDLTTPLSKVAGIGPFFAKRVEGLNLFTVSDLINHFPFRYDDFSQILNIKDAPIGEKVTLRGEIWSIKNIYTRSGKVLTQAIFNDGTAPVVLTWFSSSWITKQIETGDKLQVSGKLTKYKNKLTIMAPQWEPLNQLPVTSYQLPSIHTGRLVPIYPETFGVTSKWLRSKISILLPTIQDQIQEILPSEVRSGLLPLNEAIYKIHFPENLEEATKARETLAFNELFFIQLGTLKVKSDWQKRTLTAPLKIEKAKINQFIKSLPFKLTKSQMNVLSEILLDLQKGYPMNRLLQGEVGSGKTIVATLISYILNLNGYKTLFMAPTEILAAQHFETLKKFLEPFGITIGIYTGSRKYTKIQEKDPKSPDVIIGTHAILSSKLNIPDVGLIIIDEQQRFGVEQRGLLRSKAKLPHFLTLTATPIPRTVALTLYGDLDISVIKELPKGRKMIQTFVVPAIKRAGAYNFIAKKIREGGQAYIITPFIEQSETMSSVKAAGVEFERLQKEIFPDFKLGLLHGRLKSKEKEDVMRNFSSGKIDILVSTSVVEVGIDVSNATIMMIEGSERFGLAQLHQLRGRVGRGQKESFCLLFSGSEDNVSISRLKHLEDTFDGLTLSELDLKIRGSGEIFGTRQSGRFQLKIASFSDLKLLESSKNAAKQILTDDPTLDKYPTLQAQLSHLANVMPD